MPRAASKTTSTTDAGEPREAPARHHAARPPLHAIDEVLLHVRGIETILRRLGTGTDESDDDAGLWVLANLLSDNIRALEAASNALADVARASSARAAA